MRTLNNICKIRPVLYSRLLQSNRKLLLVGTAIRDRLVDAGYKVDIDVNISDPLYISRSLYVTVPGMDILVEVTYSLCTNVCIISCNHDIGNQAISYTTHTMESKYVNGIQGLLEELPITMGWFHRHGQCRVCHYGSSSIRDQTVFCGKGLDVPDECNYYIKRKA